MLDVFRDRYHFRGEPFRLSPDHEFAFPHPTYANAWAYLKYGIAQGEGFVAIIGAAGTGKTTLINQLLAEIDTGRIVAARLSAAQLDADNLLRLVADAFGLQLDARRERTPLQELEQFLRQQDQRGRHAVLIVDEAQGLSPSSLEVLRLLSNIQSSSRLLLQVFLMGQERLLEMIRAPGMEQLHQRLVAAAHLEPLDLDRTVDYVEHRLCHVGWTGDPAISGAALRLVHKHSGGVARWINLICHRLFLSGGLQDKHAFGADDARRVVEELRGEGLLGAEACGEASVDEDLVLRPKKAETPVRCLSRPGSFTRSEQPQGSEFSPDPKDHALCVAGQIQSLSPEPHRDSHAHSAVRLGPAQLKRPMARVEPETGMDASENESSAAAQDHGKDRSLSHKLRGRVNETWPRGWRWVAAAGLAGCLAFIATTESPIEGKALNFLSSISTRGAARVGDEAAQRLGQSKTVNGSPVASAGNEATNAKSSVSVKVSGVKVASEEQKTTAYNPDSTEKQASPGDSDTAAKAVGNRPTH